MTQRKTRVFILQEIIPSYRRPVFERLAQLQEYNITIFCSPLGAARQTAGFAQELENLPFDCRLLPHWERRGKVYQFAFLKALLGRPDLVICGKPGALDSLLFLLLAKLLRVKFLWWTGGTPFVEPEDIERDAAGGKLRKLLGNWHPRRQLAFMANGMIVYSEHAGQYYRSLGYPAAKIFVAPNSPDTDSLLELRKELLHDQQQVQALRHRYIPEGGQLLLMIGRLDSSHRIHDLLRALAILQREMPNLGLVLVGSGNESQSLKQLARELELRYIRFLDAVYDNAALAAYLAACDLLVTPGVGSLSIEMAMTFNKPVVSCDHGLQTHTIEDGWNGFIFPRGDFQAMAERIKTILTDKSLQREMAANAGHTIQTRVNMQLMVEGFRCALAANSQR